MRTYTVTLAVVLRQGRCGINYGNEPGMVERLKTDDGAGASPDQKAEERYTIGELAEDAGVTARAIRFYEARGLLTPLRIGTTRSYSARDRARLHLILRGKNLGFTLEDISEYLALYDADPAQIAQTHLLLNKVEEAISGLEMKRADIERALGDLKDIRSKCVAHLADKKSGG